MGFIPISIEKYIEKHIERNPAENEADLRKRLISALSDYSNRIKCSCGNDIWVVGSASVGNSCFTCITGEKYPTDDYEIDSAINKSESKKGRKHIDHMENKQIHGFFDDDGYEINTELIRKPSLCLTCINDDDPKEELLCQMTRYDQKGEQEFKCYSYVKLT